MLPLPPLSLYIHFPWCVRKCPYCDFNSHALRGTIPEADYINRLLADLESDLPFVAGRKLISIFMGGGTPSLFSPQYIDSLLNAIQRLIPFDNKIEITLEANPGTVEQQRFAGYRQAGINRLSLGIQSFNSRHLQQLGRIHNDHDARCAIESAVKAGLTHFNLDLMFGLPQQNLQQGLADLHTAMSFQPTHLSWYQLTLEPNTLFFQKPPALPEEETIWQLQQAGQQSLQQHGYQHYEISAYCQFGRPCRHNLNYWEFGDYLGIGAGAHSKLTTSEGKIIRSWKYKHPKKYLTSTQDFIEGKKELTDKEKSFDFMLNALRLQKPISKKLFTQRTGLDISAIKNPLARAIELNLMTVNDDVFQPTKTGYQYHNDLLELFL